MSDVYLRKTKRVKSSNDNAILTFAQIYFMFGGLILICCGVASKVLSSLIEFSKTESNTLKVFSLLHYSIGGAAILQGSVGLAWLILKKKQLFKHAKRLHVGWSLVFFIAASANTIIFQTKMSQRFEPDHVALAAKKVTSFEWKAIQTLFHCCGYNSYADWLHKNSTFFFVQHVIPLECCEVEDGNAMGKDLDEIRCLEEAKRTPRRPNFIHVSGCKEYIRFMINVLGATTTILCFGFSVFQLLSLLLTNKIKTKRPSDSDVLED